MGYDIHIGDEGEREWGDGTAPGEVEERFPSDVARAAAGFRVRHRARPGTAPHSSPTRSHVATGPVRARPTPPAPSTGWWTRIHSFDVAAMGWFGPRASPPTIRVGRMVTELGSTAVVAMAATAVGLAAVTRTRAWRPAAYLLAGIGGQSLVYNAVKRLARRERPAGPYHAGWTGASFPSGHTSAAAASWPAMVHVVATATGRSLPRLRALALVPGPAVGTTRVLLGVHWPSDVLAGLALGWGWIAAVTWLEQRVAS